MLPGAIAAAVGTPSGRHLPLLLWCWAAATDFVDGPLARRHGPTAHGALLDGLADVTFVVAGTGAAARYGVLPAVVPVAIVVAFAAYAAASLRHAAGGPARTRLGHAAGVLNYALTGLATVALAWPGVRRAAPLGAAGWLVATVNVAAVVTRARATRGAGTRARSARSSA